MGASKAPSSALMLFPPFPRYHRWGVDTNTNERYNRLGSQKRRLPGSEIHDFRSHFLPAMMMLPRSPPPPRLVYVEPELDKDLTLSRWKVPSFWLKSSLLGELLEVGVYSSTLLEQGSELCFLSCPHPSPISPVPSNE